MPKTSKRKKASKKSRRPRLARAQKALLPKGYVKFLNELKVRIRSAQLKAIVSANREMILLHWEIGRRIVAQQEKEGWGAAVIKRLAADLHRAFPEMKGFSAHNIWRMRSFYLTYSGGLTILPQAAAEIPWFHHVILLEKVKDPAAREWYIQQTVAGEEYSLDLLFYHLRLRCFIVIELKAGPFKPEYAGKLNSTCPQWTITCASPGIIRRSVCCSARREIK